MRVAVVLAAGSSRRMGRPKLGLPIAGKPMSRRVVESLLAAGFERVRLVVAPGTALELPEDPRLEVVENPDAGEGMASSIRRGVERLPAGTSVVAIALGDLPFVEASTVSVLLRAFEETGRNIVVPEYHGREGHPVLWPCTFVEELRDLEGDRGAKEVIARHRDQVRAVPVEDPGVHLDIDTDDDYAKALAFAKEKRS